MLMGQGRRWYLRQFGKLSIGKGPLSYQLSTVASPCGLFLYFYPGIPLPSFLPPHSLPSLLLFLPSLPSFPSQANISHGYNSTRERDRVCVCVSSTVARTKPTFPCTTTRGSGRGGEQITENHNSILVLYPLLMCVTNCSFTWGGGGGGRGGGYL